MVTTVRQEWHTIACGRTRILFCMEPVECAERAFDHIGKMAGVVLRLAQDSKLLDMVPTDSPLAICGKLLVAGEPASKDDLDSISHVLARTRYCVDDFEVLFHIVVECNNVSNQLIRNALVAALHLKRDENHTWSRKDNVWIDVLVWVERE